MQVREAARRESLATESLFAIMLAATYLCAEFAWDLLGGQPYLGRAVIAVASAILAWIVVAATIPGWPAARRLLLCLAVCAALDIVTQVRVYENMSRFAAVHTGSDDFFYLKSGSQFAALLGDANTLEAYAGVYASLPYTPHIGFIVLLGHLFSLVPADDLSQWRAVALLNLFVLQWLAALVVRLGSFAPRQLGLVLLLLLLPGFDLFYFAAGGLKDPAIVLLLVMLTAYLLDLGGKRITVRRLAAMGLIATALFFLRNFYVVLPPLALLLTYLRARQGRPLRRIAVRVATLLGLAAAVSLITDSMWFQQVSLEGTWSRKIAESGWGAQIYNVPVAGPVIYALITPLPPRLSELATGTVWTDFMRSVGTAAILILLAVQAAAAVRTRAMSDKRWRTFLHVGALVFVLSAYGSLEARHRLASLPCIVICYGIALRRTAVAPCSRRIPLFEPCAPTRPAVPCP